MPPRSLRTAKKENCNVKWESRLVYERQNCKETMYRRAYMRDCPRFVYKESITVIFFRTAFFRTALLSQ